jgi:hypothetical protein
VACHGHILQDRHVSVEAIDVSNDLRSLPSSVPDATVAVVSRRTAALVQALDDRPPGSDRGRRAQISGRAFRRTCTSRPGRTRHCVNLDRRRT